MKLVCFKCTVVLIGLLLLLSFLVPCVYAQEVKQPIAFSHKIHAKDNEIACEYCHTAARRSSVSSVPPLRTCMGCHMAIKGTTKTQKAEITKLTQFWQKKKPIQWKKIYDLPDFVYFSHERHIKVGFDCTECHGEIKEQEVITRHSMKTNLSMGWCVDCHRKKHVTKDNKVIIPLRRTRGGALLFPKQNIQTFNKNNATLKYIKGSVDCLVCHK